MTKGRLTIVVGDVTSPQFTSPGEIAVIPHICNNKNIWGSGFLVRSGKNQKECIELFVRVIDLIPKIINLF